MKILEDKTIHYKTKYQEIDKEMLIEIRTLPRRSTTIPVGTMGGKLQKGGRKILGKKDCMAKKSIPKRKNPAQKDDKQKKMNLHTNQNHRTTITYKRKINLLKYYQIHTKWPKQLRTSATESKNTFQTRIKRIPFIDYHTTKLAQLPHIFTNTKEIK